MTRYAITLLLSLLISLGGVVCSANAQATENPGKPDKTDKPSPIDGLRQKMDNGLRGVLLATFMDRSPDSSLASMITRIKYRTTEAPAIYNIEDETFVLYVPKAYDPTIKYGLVVYISNVPAFVPPVEWQQVLDDHKLIWISANNSDKSKPAYRRMGMVLDAVYNTTLRYTIDTNRIYIAGMHTGGELASVLAVHYPQTFAGGLFIHGCLYHRDIRAAKDDPVKVDEGYRRPMMDKLYRAKTENRYVLLTGEKASDLPTFKTLVNRGFLEDRFKHVQLLVMPDTTTTRPDAKWLSKAFDALEPVEVPVTTTP